MSKKMMVYVFTGASRLSGKKVTRQVREYKGEPCIIYQGQYFPLTFYHRGTRAQACLDHPIGVVK